MEVTRRECRGDAAVSRVGASEIAEGTVVLAVTARYVTAGRADGAVHVGVHLDDEHARDLFAALTAFYATRDEHDDEPAEVRP